MLAQAGNRTWSATQELYEPMLNTTLAAGTAAEVHTSAVFAPETNLMTIRLRSAMATTLTLRLSTQLPHACSKTKSCMADLPMTFATRPEAGGGAALTMQREANHWVNNEAVLVECDPELIPTVGERKFDIAATTGGINLHGGAQPGGVATAVAAADAECLALLPAEGAPYPASVRHHPTTDSIVSKGTCGSAESKWSLGSSGEIKHASSGNCAVYSTSDWSVAVFPEDCSPGGLLQGRGEPQLGYQVEA